MGEVESGAHWLAGLGIKPDYAKAENHALAWLGLDVDEEAWFLVFPLRLCRIVPGRELINMPLDGQPSLLCLRLPPNYPNAASRRDVPKGDLRSLMVPRLTGS